MDKIKLDPGIYNVFKPYGWTSFDVVNKMKRISGIKKIGHSGTLDPMATGVLIVAIGREFTKTISELTNLPKSYMAEITFGIVTDTYDLEGRITQMKRPESICQKDVEDVLPNFIGNIKQKPPIYSALKKNGKKLYEYARKNQEVEIEEREVTISSINVLGYKIGAYPTINIKADVSKGTYIRSLAYDIGEKLEVGAVLSKLVRYSVGDYCVKDSYKLEQFY